MNSHEVVCLSSDEDEKTVPVIVSTRSVASINSSTIDINSDSEENVVNGKNEIKKEKNGIENDDCEAGPSTSSPPPSSPPCKKKKAEFTTIAESNSAKTEFETSPKRKSRKSILAEENKQLFEQLLTKCEEVDGTQDIKKGTAKARKHFECAQIEFITSKEFKNTVQTSLSKVNRECVWGHLGELVKQLKLFKEREGDLTGSQKEIDEKKQQLASTDKDTYYQVLKNEQDERLVNKLHKILKKIHKQILKLEAQEVDFEDEDDSSYIMLERYKARASKVYEKLAQLTNYPEHADRMSKRKVTFSGTDIPSVNKCIERFVNQNHCFPDYQDVFKLIETVNTAENLGLTSFDVKVMASKAFRDIGGEIKRRRQWDVEDSLYIHLDRGDVDTSTFENDPELQSKLNDNGKVFVEKFNKVIEDFTQKQMLEQQTKKEKAKNGDKSGTSSEENSGDEGSEKEDGESEEEESDEKPVDEEFESDNERDSEAGNSSGHEDEAEGEDGETEDAVEDKEDAEEEAKEGEESDEDEDMEEEGKGGGVEGLEKEDGEEKEKEGGAEKKKEGGAEKEKEGGAEKEKEGGAEKKKEEGDKKGKEEGEGKEKKGEEMEKDEGVEKERKEEKKGKDEVEKKEEDNAMATAED